MGSPKKDIAAVKTDTGPLIALVVDADPMTRNTLAALLPFCGVPDVRQVHTIDDALAALHDPIGILLCDPCMEGQRGVTVFEAALQLQHVPQLIALSNDAPRAMVFRLRDHGVGALLEKPFQIEQVKAAIEEAADGLAPLAQLARARVGTVGAKEAQRLVRRSMFEEALSRTRGNRHAAARLLRVDRRVVQLMANSLQESAE